MSTLTTRFNDTLQRYKIGGEKTMPEDVKSIVCEVSRLRAWREKGSCLQDCVLPNTYCEVEIPKVYR